MAFGFEPNTIILGTPVYAALRVHFLFPGRWPWDWLRRKVLIWALIEVDRRQARLYPPEPDCECEAT